MVKLGEIRRAQGKSFRQLGREARVSLATIQRIEGGEFDPRLSTLRRLAKALKVSLATLLGESETETQSQLNQRKEKSMPLQDDFKARNKAVDEAIKALKVWERDHLRKTLYANGKQWGIWDYEYNQLKAVIRPVHTLLENLKDEDLRRKE